MSAIIPEGCLTTARRFIAGKTGKTTRVPKERLKLPPCPVRPSVLDCKVAFRPDLRHVLPELNITL